MTRAALVVNPTKLDGGPDRAAVEAAVRAAADRAGWELLCLETTPDGAGGVVREALAQDVDLVVACGGDGTVRECAEALAGTDVTLALLPAGTGNLLARNLGVPLDRDDALDVLTTGVDRRIDLVRFDGDRRFAVMAGMGLDAHIMGDSSDAWKDRVGAVAYVMAALRRLRDRRMAVRLRVDGGPWRRCHAHTVIVGNVGELQNRVALLPDALPDDGVLDVVLLSPRTLGAWASVAWRLLRRHPGAVGGIQRFRGRRVEVRADGVHPRELDGDTVEPGDAFVAEVDAGALLVRMPRG